MEKAVDKRNYGIDLLRIVSMILVVVLHVCGQGGVMENIEPGSANYVIIWLIQAVGFCSVNCYAMISGFVGYGSKFKYSSIAEIYLTVVFYMLAIAGVFKIIMPEAVGINDFIKAFIPFISGGTEYWYFTAYLCAFFFFPYLKSFVNNSNKKTLAAYVLVAVIFFSIIPTVINVDVFGAYFGYSPLWLMVLYCFGAYIKKYEVGKNLKTYKGILMFFVLISLTALIKLGLERCVNIVCNTEKLGAYLVSYTSPGTLLSSVVAVLVFANLKISKGFIKAIKLFAPLSFGVYIIHCQPLIWQNVWKGMFSSYADLNGALLVCCVLFTAVAVWLLCSIADLVRFYLFKLLKVKKLSAKAEEKIKNILNKYIAEE